MGVFKLGKMTFGSLFKKPETVLYPIETKPQPSGLKGHIAIDAEACILCGMCDRSCATNCITVNKAEGYWEIDRFQCVQCGYCITVCPKKCLSMDPNYAPASTVRKPDRVEVASQPKAEKPAKVQDDSSKAKADESQAEKLAETVKEAVDEDAILMAKIALMEPEKAQRVREALEAHGR